MDFPTGLDAHDMGFDKGKCPETQHPRGLDNFLALTAKNVYIQKKKNFRAKPQDAVSRARLFCLSNLQNLSTPNSDGPFVKSKLENPSVNPVMVTPC